MFRFKKISAPDFPQMLEWLSKNHIKQWWNDGDDTLEKVRLHYGAEDKNVSRFILVKIEDEVEKSIGYFQYYLDNFKSDRTIGIDQFIGEEEYLDKGVGAQTIKLFIELIKEQYQPTAIVLDPSTENKRAINCYRKVGFRHYKTVTDEYGQTVYLMRLEI